MKIVVIGCTGLIGSKVAAILDQGSHQAVAASPKSDVNAITGEGLNEVMIGAQTMVDVSNAPSFDATSVFDFFESSGRSLLAAEVAAGVQHHCPSSGSTGFAA